MTEPEPAVTYDAAPPSPGAPPTLQAAVDAIGTGVAVLLGPLVAMVQDRDEALEALLASHQALRLSHAALLDLTDRLAVRPNWAADVRTLEQARALQDSLRPDAGGTPR